MGRYAPGDPNDCWSEPLRAFLQARRKCRTRWLREFREYCSRPTLDERPAGDPERCRADSSASEVLHKTPALWMKGLPAIQSAVERTHQHRKSCIRLRRRVGADMK